MPSYLMTCRQIPQHKTPAYKLSPVNSRYYLGTNEVHPVGHRVWLGLLLLWVPSTSLLQSFPVSYRLSWLC